MTPVASPMVVAEAEYLAHWLCSVVAPLVDDPASLSVQPRLESPDAVVLVVRAARGHDLGRVVGRSGAVIDGMLRPLARIVGIRHGLRRVDVEVVEA
jgi:predicted RNA-binding protein YlqC (UPF0109 family)